ncbi:D-aminoacyl-tRNA deacylase 2-like isoform X3 [Lytechinus pictus]|uniref:D-aminoacyl-tRNA deacylase 2-like isoform X3 n=1 Tax=Lytechinus pictus TaxID=7653 RepID=UPI0030B9DE04
MLYFHPVTSFLMAEEKKSGVTSNLKAKIVIQQCLSATLQVKPQSDGVEAEYVEIDRGVVLYVCFLKGADEETVEKMAKFALNIRLSEALTGSKLVSILDLPGDILVVPQATLGGKAKGKMMQYHSNISKDTGRELYQKFVDLCEADIARNARTSEANCKVRGGTYGNRQVLSLQTNGPFTHTMEF